MKIWDKKGQMWSLEKVEWTVSVYYDPEAFGINRTKHSKNLSGMFRLTAFSKTFGEKQK